MTRLIDLRRRLANLRRRRQRIRVGTALTGMAAALLTIVAAVFLLDWLFEMTRVQRAVLLLLGVAATGWAFYRYFLPWVGYEETDLQMALLVERQHNIDTDLIAALEFESPQAPAWGSPALEAAVIDHAAGLSQRLNVMQGISLDALKRRALVFGVACVAWTVVAIFFPYHVATFFQRMLMSNVHYPTRTHIEAITVRNLKEGPVDNGGAAWQTVDSRKVDPQAPDKKPVRIYYGGKVQIDVACDRRHVPAQPGRVVLSGVKSGTQTTLELARASEGDNLFTAEWARPIESVDVQVYLGDAWTEQWRLELTEPPVIEIQPEVIPPMYAGKETDRIQLTPGLLQFSVVEGSQVRFRLVSDKWLKSAYLEARNDDGAHTYRLEAVDSDSRKDGRHVYMIGAAEGEQGPLGAVTQLTRYTIQVVDVDGQQLERPKEGLIRIQADGPPRIVAQTVTRYVLPTGQPTVYFGAHDDYGIGKVTVTREITHGDVAEEDELTVYELPSTERPLKTIQQGVVLDFKALKNPKGEPRLVKGDTVKITLRATDFRGKQPGKMALAEPLVFQVTDEQGILAGMIEHDQRSAEQLKVMIQRQLGIGDSP